MNSTISSSLGAPDIFFRASLVTSNIWFLWPIMEFAFDGKVYIAVMLFLTMSTSSFYHICYLFERCIATFGETPRMLDHAYANYGIALITLIVTSISDEEVIQRGYSFMVWSTVYSAFLFYVSLTTVMLAGPSNLVFVVLVLAVIFLVLVRFLILPSDDPRTEALLFIHKYRTTYLKVAIFFALFGVTFYLADNVLFVDSYPIFHPPWHIYIACAQALLARSIRYKKLYQRLRLAHGNLIGQQNC